MDLNDYFDPIEIDDFNILNLPEDNMLSEMQIHTKDNPIENIDNYQVALFALADNKEEIVGINKIREKFYSLVPINKSISLYDIGNIKHGKTKKDRFAALKDVTIKLINADVLPILICLDKNYHYAIYKAYSELGKLINLSGIDSKIDLNNNFLNEILINDSESLFSFCNIGYQQYFTGRKVIDKLAELNQEAFRLGRVRTDVSIVEPILRASNSLYINLSSVKQTDAPGNNDASPNGFYSEEICQLLKYGGISDKISSLAIYGFVADNDRNNQTAHLIAQMLWYFLDGFSNRIYEFPSQGNSNYTKFIVNINSTFNEIIFYKSENTGRWWVEIPYIASENTRGYIIPCNYSDYQETCKNEVPTLWLKGYQKIN